MTDFDTSDLKKVAIYEPRLKINNQREWVIIKGGQTVTTTVYPATSYSNSYFNFTTNPPGKKNVLDRHVIIQVPVTLTFTGPGDATTNLMIQQGRDAFRSYPIATVTASLTARLNGFPVTIESNKFVHVLENFHSKIDVMNTYQSIYPNMTDTYQNYSDGDVSNKNPLGSYSDNSSQIPRGAYDITITNNTNTSATVNAVIYEQIVLPPFLFDDSQAGGLTNLDTLEFNFVLDTNLWKIWSRSESNTVPLTSLSVVFGNPSMLLNWITPRDTQLVPDKVRYPYFQLSRYIQSNVTGNTPILPNTSYTASSQVIQLNSIPKKIYIYVKQSDQVINQSLNLSVNSTDTYFKIDNISISWDNLDGILSGSQDVNLYEMSVNNGINYDFVSWRGYTTNYGTVVPPNNNKIGLKGSIVCLCPGVDFGLRNSQAEGVLDKINFQVTVQFRNINQTKSLIPDLCVIAVYDGYLDIYNNSAKAVIGAISNEDVLTTPITYDISYHELQKVYGGDFFSKLRDTGSKMFKGIKDVNKFLRDGKYISKAANLGSYIPGVVGDVSRDISKVSSSLGYGIGKGKGGTLYGGCYDNYDSDEERYEGGKLVQRKKLMKRLKNK